MKKIRCVRDRNDFLELFPSGITNKEWFIVMCSETDEICLDAHAIRKLRKQLKRALVEIEGNNAKESKSCDCDQCVERTKDEEDDWFSVGKEVKIVKRLHGHGFKIGQIVKHAGKTPVGNEKLESLDGSSWYAVHKSECMPA